MANNDKENKIEKFTKEAIGKTLNQFNKEIGMADLVEINKNQDRILNGILSQVNDENTEKTEKSNIITLDNSTDGIVELKEIQGDTNVNVSKIEEMPITHDIGDKEGNVFTLNEIPKGAISIGEIQGNTMVNCNKDDKKELVLMKDLSTEGDNGITLTEGVDGGKVDVALEGNTLVNVSKTKNNYITHEREEDTTGNHIALADEGYIRPVLNGNTMVNVCDQKDPIAVTKSYTVENSGNHVALQGEYDGKCRPNIYGNTLVNIIQAFWDDADAEYDFSTGRYKVVADGTSKHLYYTVNAKTNTKYTVIANIKKNTINNNFALVGWGVTVENKQVTVPNGFTGLFISVITTSESNLGNVWYADLWKESTEGEIEIDGFMILEGDYSNKPIPDYFTGLQSSFEDGLVPESIINMTGTYRVSNSSVVNPTLTLSTNLKANTVYTRVYHVSNLIEGNNIARPSMYDMVQGATNKQYPTYQLRNGWRVETFTNLYEGTGYAIIVDSNWRNNNTNEGRGFTIDKFFIIEGDWSNYDFSDYDPTKVGKYRVDYKVTGKNKFNFNSYNILNNKNNDIVIDISTQSITMQRTDSSNYEEIEFNVNLLASKKYTLSYTYETLTDNNAPIRRFKFVYEDGTYRSFNHRTTTFESINEHKRIVKISISMQEIESDKIKMSNIQIEEGDTATAYETYKGHTKTLYLNSPLLEGDTIEQYGNNIVHVHRYGKVVLDGSENWKISSINDRFPGQYLCYLVYPNVSFVHDTEMSPIMCDKFKVVSPGNTNLSNVSPDSISVSGIESNLSEKAFRLSISESKLSSLDLAGFRKYLLANPITVVYKLVSPQYEVISINDKLLTDSYVNGHLDFESAVPVEKVDFSGTGKTLKYLQSSTSYDIQFNADANGSLDYIVLGDEAIKTNIQVTKGINKINLTTISSTVPFLYFNGIGFNASNIVVTPAIEQDFDYFSGLSSTFESELITDEADEHYGKYRVKYKVAGKNKFNINDLLAFSSQSNNGMIASIENDKLYIEGTATGIYDFRPVARTYNKALFNIVNKAPVGTSFTLSNNLGGKNYWSVIRNGELQFITNTITKQQGDNEIHAFVRISQGTSISKSEFNIQVEEGDTATPYESYKEHIKTLYLNSPLLEGDTIEEKDGGIYHVHRSSCALLDNKIGWSIRQDSEANTIFVESQDLNSSRFQWNSKCIADTIISKNDIDRKDEECIGTNGSIRLRINKSKLSSLDEVGIKAYLKDNPIKACFYLRKPEYELIEQSNLAMPSYANGHLDLTSAVPVSKVNFLHFEEELTYLYPSTSYTVQFISDKAISVDITLGGTELLAQNITKGLNRITITTPETLVNNKLVIDGVGAKISKVVVTDTDREFKYFEGMKSVGECEELEVKSINANLFRNPNIQFGNLKHLGNGEYVSTNQWGTICKIDVTPGEKYTLCYKIKSDEIITSNGTSFFRLNNPNGTIVGNTALTETVTTDYVEYTSTFTPNYSYVEVCIRNSVIKTLYVKDIMIIKGEGKLYRPPKEDTQQLTHEPLRAVGDVKDRYVMVDGKWFIERRCGYNDIENYSTINDEDVRGVVVTFNNRKRSSLVICDSIKLGSSNPMIPGTFYINPINIVVVFDKNNPIADEDMLKKVSQCNFVHQLETPTYEPIDYNPLEVYSDMTHITTNSAVPTNITIKNHGCNCLLKPSTTYTVSSNLGLDTVTTGADIGDSCLRFYDEDTSDVTTMKDVLILEGDWTSKANLIPSNFSGIKSVFEQELVTDKTDEHFGKYKVVAKIIGKNLFDESSAKVGYYWRGDDILATVENSIASEKYLKVVPGMILLANNQSSSVQYMEYDSNKKFIQRVNKGSGTTYKVPNNVAYLRFSFYASNNTNFQIEQVANECVNSLAQITPHEPYKESDVTFYIDEPLRGIRDVKDKVYVKDDKVVVERNCGSVVLDGSEDENWLSNVSSSSIIRFCYANLRNVVAQAPSNIVSDYFPSNNDTQTLESVFMYTNDGIVIAVSKAKLKTQDLSGFKQWLQQNPTTVVYQLASPTYEEVEYSSNRLILDTFNNESFNNSTLFLDTNISPKLSFKPLYEELVYVKNSTKYYIQFNAVGSGEVVINLGGTELTTEIVEGYNCIPITTPSESTNLMVISGQGITIGEVIVSEVVCGGYYKGLQSCFEEHMENGKYRVLLRGIALDGSKVNGIKLYINEPLRGIGDAKDRLCIKNGKLMVERKCKEIILNGSNYVPRCLNTMNEGIKRWELYKNEDIMTNLSNANVIINDRYKVVSPDATWGNIPYEDGICANSVGHSILIYLDKYNDDSNTSKNALISELQENPVKIVYKLVESTYEEVTNEYGLPIVFEGYENGIVYIDSAVTPTTHIKYTSNNQLATTLSEAEEQNIATQEDINMNVITYMMDIDMILTEMEMSNDTSVMAVRRDSNSNENMLDRMSKEDKKVYQDNTVVMLEKMITANVLEKEDIEGRINMYYNKNRISKEQYEYLKSLL